MVLSKMGENAPSAPGSLDPASVLNFYNSMSTEGTLFRFKADPGDEGTNWEPIIYIITGSTIPDGTKYNFHQNSYGNCVYCGSTDGDDVCQKWTFKANFARASNMGIGLNTALWDPRSAVTHDGSSKLNIEIVEASYDPTDIEPKVDGNAVWETEPKEDVGLDLYYEVTSAIPMKLENKNIESFAPVDSIISCFRENATVNPTNIYDCYIPDVVNLWPASPVNNSPETIEIKTAFRDVIGLGGVDEAPDETYPFAVFAHNNNGDVLSFTRPDGMVTEARVIDHWEPLNGFNNIQPYTITVPGTAFGQTIQEEIPFSASTYKSSKEYTITGQLLYWANPFPTGDGNDWQITVNTASIPEGFDSFNNKIYQVSCDTLNSIKPGTFTIRQGIRENHPISGQTAINIKHCATGLPSDLTGQHEFKFKEVTGYYRLEYKTYKTKTQLPWFNCYSFGNGLESDRIRDDYNSPTIDNGCKVSTVLEDYSKENRSSGLIWSGIYNSTSGVNNLNEFNMAEAITKDLNPTYGSIQALKSRDTNMLAFCEDKVLKILANKDALYNADGSSNVTASNAVLGDASGLAGDYGISKNPESLAFDGYRMYFTDKQRGKVFRLSQDGLTPISDVNMSTYFRDKLKGANQLIGTFDEIKGEYNLTIKHPGVLDVYNAHNELTSAGFESSGTTVSFNEKNKGWSSFKSFIPETGLSINDEYITAANNNLWSHHNSEVDSNGNLTVNANNFYGYDYESTIDVMFNDNPGSVKGFTTINYEGTQARITEFIKESLHDSAGNSLTNVNDGEYYNLTSKDGWYVDSFNTDLQESKVVEFIDKEGKWFSYIDGISTTLENLDTSEFTVQGLGTLSDISTTTIVGCMDISASNYNANANMPPDPLTQSHLVCFYSIPGCTDPNANNFNSLATISDGSCTYTVVGCMDGTATNYNILATEPCPTEEIHGTEVSCCNYDGIIVEGCTNPLADNYNPNATSENGSCIYDFVGCMDSHAINYNQFATISDNHLCEYEEEVHTVYGCMNPTAENYNPLATDSGDTTCIIYGCTNADATNYNPDATIGDDSCIEQVSGCMDSTATNYDPNANYPCGLCCEFPVYGCMDLAADNYNASADIGDGSCIYSGTSGCMDATAYNYNPNATIDDGSCIEVVYGCMNLSSQNYSSQANIDDGSCVGYVYGCMDENANNYDPLATLPSGNPNWCTYTYYGCTNPSSANYNADATEDDGSCTDSTCGSLYASNYNSDYFDANEDTFTAAQNPNCQFDFAAGCTDPTADNYNSHNLMLSLGDWSSDYMFMSCAEHHALYPWIPQTWGCNDDCTHPPDSWNLTIEETS
jgi:hypothetical protein